MLKIESRRLHNRIVMFNTPLYLQPWWLSGKIISKIINSVNISYHSIGPIERDSEREREGRER